MRRSQEETAQLEGIAKNASKLTIKELFALAELQGMEMTITFKKRLEEEKA